MSQDTRPAENRAASGTDKPAVLKRYKCNSSQLQHMLEMFIDAVVNAAINSFLRSTRYLIFFFNFAQAYTSIATVKRDCALCAR
jgi:hypothetical protein